MAVETVVNKARIEASGGETTRTVDAQGDMGKTSIADTVIAKIAGLAALQIAGVHQLVTTGLVGSLAGFAQRLSRADQRGQGVAVEVGQKEAAVDLAIQVDFGVNIRQVCDSVRQSVASRIEAMTGLRVTEVNVLVADLHFPEAEGPAPYRRVE